MSYVLKFYPFYSSSILLIYNVTKLLYFPSYYINSLCDPSYTTFPLLITNILSLLIIVLNLCAIVIVVLFSAILSNVYYINISFYLSNADVASSNNNILGFFNNALAIAILYF